MAVVAAAAAWTQTSLAVVVAAVEVEVEAAGEAGEALRRHRRPVLETLWHRLETSDHV